jgi:hypothetical protein
VVIESLTEPGQRGLAAVVTLGMRPYALFGVKAFHSLAFWVIQSAIVYLLYKGWRRESDRRAAIAFAIAAGESAIYAGNGFRCPLTSVAEELGSDHGQVTDIFLPKWLASNVARIYVPLLVAGIVLHVGNVLGRKSSVFSSS